ncbi:MAG: hypothetical protein JW941_10080 [Candidatus Coatesbacteria bacterium]|nr:hypothetical protein [Candidatus Coatesbacteria bacterium]
MAEIVCPHCRVKVPYDDKGPDPTEIVECLSCGMLIDMKDLARRYEERDVADEWDQVKARRRKEINFIVVIVLLALLIAGITIYMYCVLNP